jgi:outer membrane protein assembly factor BamA
MPVKYFLLLSICCFATAFCHAQNTVGVPVIFTTDIESTPFDSVQQLTVSKITIDGNGKTKAAIIHRELGIQEGEIHTLSLLAEQLITAKNALMRSGLFRNVSLSLLRPAPHEVHISVWVEERWYLFPMPFIKPVDYSFMEWVTDKNRSYRRINYGMHLTHRNFTGRNDKLNLSVVNGFSQQFGLQYYGLFLDKALKWYSNFGVYYGRSRAVNAINDNNRRISVHTANNDFVHSYFRAHAEVNYRPAIKTRHAFGIGFVQERAADTIFTLSPGYSPQARNMRFFDFFYRMSYADVDLMAYPTKGRITEIGVIKKGFSRSISLWQVNAKNALAWPVLKNKYIFNLRSAAMLKLPFDQPRITKNFIGTEGMFLQGYEDYMIEGVAGGYVKASIARPLFGKTFYAPAKFVPAKLQRFRAVPFKLYARAFINTGYVYDPHPELHSLSNRLLCSAGLGLDVVAFADWVVKIEWSFNLLGQNGLYLHPHNSF